MALTYTRYEGNTKITDEVKVGDHVLQNAYGKGMGRLEDCGRRGVVVAVNRVKAVVRFDQRQYGTRPVHPGVLRLEGRAITAEPRQLPGMARLMELTPELVAHYAD